MKRTPPCPDPERYTLYKKANGKYAWRLKRGTIKPAVLNPVLSAHAKHMVWSAPAARQITLLLKTYTQHMMAIDRSRDYSSFLRKAKMENMVNPFSFFLKYDLHKKFPFGQLLTEQFTITIANGWMQMDVPIREHSLYVHNKLITEFYLELILVFGDPMDLDSLQASSERSALYDISTTYPNGCTLMLELPADVHWFALLKVGCIESDELARNWKGYGGKVVAVG